MLKSANILTSDPWEERVTKEVRVDLEVYQGIVDGLSKAYRKGENKRKKFLLI